jgi:ABC-type proline/glycine betaine transport system permease subunit
MTLWIWRFALAGVAFVVLAVLVFWAIGGLGELRVSSKGLVELTLGFLFTAGLAIGLMALVFFSDRSGRDDETNRAGERERSFP